MVMLLKVDDLDNMPDAFLLDNRVWNGQQGAILVLMAARAYALLGISGSGLSLWFIPINNYDTLVTMFDDSGLHLSYG